MMRRERLPNPRMTSPPKTYAADAEAEDEIAAEPTQQPYKH